MFALSRERRCRVSLKAVSDSRSLFSFGLLRQECRARRASIWASGSVPALAGEEVPIS